MCLILFKIYLITGGQEWFVYKQKQNPGESIKQVSPGIAIIHSGEGQKFLFLV